MTRPTDWDFSKISGRGATLAPSGPLRGEMPAFASHIEERRPHVGEALPWAEIEFERISKSPRRAKGGAQPSAVATKRRFPRIRFRHAVRLPLFRLPRLALPRLPTPRLAMPKVALPRLRALAGRGWRAAAFGFHFAAVAAIWLSAEAVYLLRLGYAHMRLALLRLALVMENRGASRFSGVDPWPLVRQAAAIAFFIAVGYGAAVIVGPVLKDDDARLAVLSPSPTHMAVSSDQTEPIASFDAEVPLPMPRIAHVSMGVREKAPVASARAPFMRAGEQSVARRLAPASQTHGEGARYASDLVSEIQIRLLRLGYPVGPPTGKQNAKTRRSILLYQRDAALPVSGKADMRLLRNLRDSESHNMRFAGR